jgi:RNA polymerase sigma-70 factor (ECF subfamily)
VLQTIDQFEGRASFKTWLFRIVANIAKRRAQQDARTVPFSALTREEDEADASVDPSRFREAGHALWPGHWAQPLARWDELPEERLSCIETRSLVEAAIAELPDLQRKVIELRDVQECTSEETGALLGITEANQRVLLHRARSKVRAALERTLGERQG